MIVTEAKSFVLVAAMITGFRRVLVAACAGCTAVCGVGGERQAGELADALRLHARLRGEVLDTEVRGVTRQCEPEFVAELAPAVARAEAVLTLGCGVGAQFLAEHYPGVPVLPGVNTRFAGGLAAPGVWEERCRLCGDCVLYLTGGVCPRTRCAKGIMNGPCGGAAGGLCEVGNATPCAWLLIWERLERLGRTGTLDEIGPPPDWSGAQAGPRRSGKGGGVE
ncbi:MAG: methylenetetrahydrofolate reductase C-terminal domain-containing protein [Bacillota bacterium]|jgi:ferredoxin